MRRGNSTAEPGDRGATNWSDGVRAIDGGSPGDVPSFVATTEELSDGPRGDAGSGAAAVGKTSWFDPVDEVSDCPGGICPVPWAVKEEAPVLQGDNVNHPPHYTDGGIECIEAIEAQLTPEEYQGYLRGNCVKYLWRWRMKGGITDLQKSQWYMDRLITFTEAQNG